LLDVELPCSKEAREVLQAGLTDPLVRHAVFALRALRKDLETSRDIPTPALQPTPNYQYGIEHYTMTLRGLVVNLSAPGTHELKSALLCCEMLISIEQVQKNYVAMAQHIIGGLSIMRKYRARSYLDASNRLESTASDQLPLLDVFLVKLFAAPCKFADSPIVLAATETTLSVSSALSHRQRVKNPERTIKPDMRAPLTRIATSTLEFLDKVSQVQSRRDAVHLLSERRTLLDSLTSWLTKFEHTQIGLGPVAIEPISSSFMRLFHQTLKIVILGTLESSTEILTTLQTENKRLVDIANNVSEKIGTYKSYGGTSRNQRERTT